MVIIVVERGLIKLRIVAIQTSNPIVSFETIGFPFKIFNKQMKQKSKYNFNKNNKKSDFEALNSFK